MTHSTNKLPSCSNCGFIFNYSENFCPDCGQKNQDLKIPVKHLLEEITESTLHLDSKALRTIKQLMFHPGLLSKEFNRGRRIKYVPPVRLYVFISFIFFFMLGLATSNYNSEREAVHNSFDKRDKIKLSLNIFGISSNELAGVNANSIDSLMKSRNISLTGSNKYIVHQLYKIANSSSAEFSHLLLKNISYMMFILMPLFGALLMIFNRKKLYYYIESLIISIHFHSFMFLIFSILLIANYLFSMQIFLFLGLILFPVYMVIMLKNILELKTGAAVIKTAVIGILYTGSLFLLLLLTIMISMLIV